jgi:CRP-like cAMP-binding protein
MENGILLKAPLFRGMDIKDIEDILAVTPHRVRKFKTGTLIAGSGEIVDKLMIVAKGVVKGEMVDYAGRVIKIEDIPAPGALATAFIFGNRNFYPVNIIATADTEIVSIDKPEFLKLMMRNDNILINFLDMISNRSQFLSEKIKFLNFKTIRGKLAHLIIQKAGSDMTIVNLGMTQNDLADFFGVARPSVARALGELEAEGFIITDRREIRILDRNGLSSLTSD